jgi:hypothetical protein
MAIVTDYDRFCGSTNANGQAHADEPPIEDRAAERALLGCMIRGNDHRVIDGSAELLRPADFSADAHRTIFGQILVLHDTGSPVDLVLLAQNLMATGQLENVGGPPYLGELWDAAPTIANWEYYAEIIRNLATRRALRRLGRKTIRLASSPTGAVSDMMEALRKELAVLSENGANKAAGLGLDEVDAAELAVSTSDVHFEYLPLLGQDGYLVRGWSHLIAGYPRTGKTELMTACCRDWLAMGDRVLYLTEEPREVWKHRLARAQNAWQGMHLVFGLGADPGKLLTRAKTGEENIIVVDAIRNLGLAGEDENDNAALARHIGPWVSAMRDARKTPFFMHHSRKGGGQHGEGIAGGHALLGAVDIALELRHDATPNRRVLKASARIIQPAELMYERQESGSMRPLGSPEMVGLDDVRRRVLEAVDGDWKKTADIRVQLDPKPSESQVREALKLEAKDGHIERDPPITEDAQRKTVRWRRTGG